MKKFKNISEFEKLVQDKLKNYNSPPPSSVLENFDFSSLKQPKAKISKITELIKSPIQVIKLATLVGVSSTILFFALENRNTDSKNVNDSFALDSNTIFNEPTNSGDIATYNENISPDTSESYKTIKNKIISASNQSLKLENTTEPESQPTTNIGLNKATNETEIAINNRSERLAVSNSKPCIGETITLKSQTKGDWFINNQILSTNNDRIEYKPDSKNPVSIRFENENGEISEVIQVIDIDYQIITEKNTQHTFLFSTSNQDLLFDWYLDDVLVAKNTNTCQLTEKQVGKHVVKTIPKNAPCIKPKSTTFQIKSSGSIKFFNVFTPNGDGTNDKYLVEINNYENYQILIYDQVKNQLVFTSDDPENPWNGSLYNQGENCPPGEYIAKIKYTLNGEKIQTKNIKFTLIRP